MIGKRIVRAFVSCAAAVVLGSCADLPPNPSNAVQRMYVFDCGESTVADMSRWTPGSNVGKPGEFSANCYLIRHTKGPVILSGDMVHLRDNWTARRLSSFNFDVGQSRQSMEKVAALMAKTGAELWINHDKAQSDSIAKSPAYIE